MHWPVTIAQDKCAIVAVKCGTTFEILQKLGFKYPNTGPWKKFGYWWRWGYTDVTNIHLINTYSGIAREAS